MYYKGFRIEVSSSGLSFMVWKDDKYFNSFSSLEAAKKAIDDGIGS